MYAKFGNFININGNTGLVNILKCTNFIVFFNFCMNFFLLT